MLWIYFWIAISTNNKQHEHTPFYHFMVHCTYGIRIYYLFGYGPGNYTLSWLSTVFTLFIPNNWVYSYFRLCLFNIVFSWFKKNRLFSTIQTRRHSHQHRAITREEMIQVCTTYSIHDVWLLVQPTQNSKSSIWLNVLAR